MKLLIAESQDFSSKALILLKKDFDIKTLNSLEEVSYKDLVETDFLWTRLHSYIGSSIINKMPKLKAIITATTGLNCIDVQLCNNKGIKILSLANESAFLKKVKATAELTISLIFLLLRDIIPAHQDVLHGSWNRDKFRGNELFQKKVGLIGYGRLGKIVANYLIAFGAKVSVYDPYVKKISSKIKKSSLKNIFRNSDIVSIHAKHTVETTKLINEELLSIIRKPIYFINTARGEIVDEDALLKFIKKGKIKKAAIDVLTNESRQDISKNPLIEYAKNNSNLIITPHLGGCCHESFEKTEIFMAKKLIKYYKNNYQLT